VSGRNIDIDLEIVSVVVRLLRKGIPVEVFVGEDEGVGELVGEYARFVSDEMKSYIGTAPEIKITREITALYKSKKEAEREGRQKAELAFDRTLGEHGMDREKFSALLRSLGVNEKRLGIVSVSLEDRELAQKEEVLVWLDRIEKFFDNTAEMIPFFRSLSMFGKLGRGAKLYLVRKYAPYKDAKRIEYLVGNGCFDLFPFR